MCSGASSEASSGIEQEKYFRMLVAATPVSNRSASTSHYSDSLTSLDSLMMMELGETLQVPNTPEQLRRNIAYSRASVTTSPVSGSGNRSSLAFSPKPTCKCLAPGKSETGIYKVICVMFNSDLQFVGFMCYNIFLWG